MLIENYVIGSTRSGILKDEEEEKNVMLVRRAADNTKKVGDRRGEENSSSRIGETIANYSNGGVTTSVV